jgi:membrane-associated phospholipid phosphatase
VASEIRWSQRTGYILSRFLGPNYVLVPLVFILGICDPVSWQRGLLWAGIVSAVGIGLPLAVFWRELHKGHISDWHISKRAERLRPTIVAATLVAAIGPVLLLLLFDGPRLLLVACVSALFLAVTNLLITLVWKISQHVSGIAATATLITATVGLWISPILLLIPLVAWARVKVGAHTVGQTLAGGVVGVTIPLLTLRLLGLV